MENLITELEKYLNLLNVEQLYNDPGHKDVKNWIAEVGALLKTNRKFAYKRFEELSQHLYPSISPEIRKHAAEQIDVFIRQIIAEYKREFVMNANHEPQQENEIDKLKIFLSYSSKNKNGAGRIKAWLSHFGCDVFLAHEDIEPALEWQKVIIKNLQECHIFIPILTPQFDESKWTDQESGMAFITNKLIISISVEREVNPHGFLGIYQALPMNPNEIERDCRKIIKAIVNDSRLSSVIIDLLIRNLTHEKSPSFASAEWKTSILVEYNSFTKEQFDGLLKTAVENNQVHYAAGSREDLQNLIKRNPQLVDQSLLKQLNDIDETFKFG